MITFVTFHADILAEEIEKNTPLDRDNFYDYQQTINLMFKSVDKFHSKCKKVILTNLETNLSFLAGDIQVQRHPVNSREIMLSRLVSQLHFLQSHDFSSDVVLLDSDILINDNLESLFIQEFDVALTVRADQEMPINGGIIYVSQKNPVSVINFFQKLYSLYTEKYQQKSQWWGDQYALADAIGYKASSKLEPGNIEIDGVNILLLPCEIYNFSPNYESDLDVCELKEQKVLHFKGLRKQYMSVYWENYLALYGLQDWQKKNAIFQQQILALHTDRLKLKATIKNSQAEKVELQRQIKSDVHTLQQEINVLQREKSKL
ncbi:MAG: hypothetical protein KME23_16750, partial [Goleter apudmare HA4340-LM2]|nr:hypothetical protein [Goleter apudmare HA4340-LM2]